jgi:hypothetical protein
MTLFATLVTAQEPPWPAPVPGYKEPAAGEHPRLFFRKADLPALRARAKTPEGQAVLRRLKETLGGGEAMPKHHRPATAPFGDKTAPIELPAGAYTISHAAGFGLLYQLTGDKKYADLGRQCFEWAFAGIRDRDNRGRYGWKGSAGALRAGPSLGWYAVGYDLCYDGWDPAFREKVARAFAEYDEGDFCSLAELARGKRQHPGSNHWGMQVGGAALALLAIRNDPGVDMAQIKPLLDANAKTMIVNLTQGFGDGGFFAEGDGTGSMSSHIAFVSALQAWRTAGGKDFITPRPNAAWLTLKWPFLTVPTGKNPLYLLDSFPARGGYPHNIWERQGLSGAGYFALGFGAVPDSFKPGLLWWYNQHLKAADDQAGTPCDTPSVYPHDAVMAFINWPFGLKPQNPTGVWPHAYRDTKWQFYAWRNRWQDSADTVISILTRGSKGNMSASGETTLTIWSQGQRMKWGGIRGLTGEYAPKPNGSTVLRTGDGSCLAIDFSGAAGCDALLAMTGPGAPAADALDVGGTKVALLLLGKNPPKPQVAGAQVIIGQQTITVEAGQLILAK